MEDSKGILLESGTLSGKPVKEYVQLIITDIEMPQMDGHHLPVIIFSSLINDEIRRKGEALGACAQVTKPEIEQLINFVDINIGLVNK